MGRPVRGPGSSDSGGSRHSRGSRGSRSSKGGASRSNRSGGSNSPGNRSFADDAGGFMRVHSNRPVSSINAGSDPGSRSFLDGAGGLMRALSRGSQGARSQAGSRAGSMLDSKPSFGVSTMRNFAAAAVRLVHGTDADDNHRPSSQDSPSAPGANTSNSVNYPFEDQDEVQELAAARRVYPRQTMLSMVSEGSRESSSVFSHYERDSYSDFGDSGMEDGILSATISRRFPFGSNRWGDQEAEAESGLEVGNFRGRPGEESDTVAIDIDASTSNGTDTGDGDRDKGPAGAVGPSDTAASGSTAEKNKKCSTATSSWSKELRFMIVDDSTPSRKVGSAVALLIVR